MDSQQIAFTLNGASKVLEIDPERTLLDVLREHQDLTGTKRGCDNEGQCGACTVIVDGRAVRSCRTPVGKVAGRQVTTIEGIGSSSALHPLQRAFIECGAVQCGYCTPGLIMAAKALLDRQPDPTREQVVRTLSGNLCRCTGYVRIIEAVMTAAAVMRGEVHRQAEPASHIIGGDPYRRDAVDKVTGRTRFANDIRMPGMLHAKVLRSPYSHALITCMDTAAALAVPGVEAVYAATDIPGVRTFSDALGARDALDDEHRNGALEPVLAGDRVRMVGEPVAIVVAASETAAQAGRDRIRVTYEVLDPICDPEVALQPSSALLHETGNLYEYGEVKVGCPDAAWPETEVEVEATISIPSRDHATIEPECALAYIDDDGRVVVIGPTHEPHVRQAQVADMLAISPAQVRVIAPALGGSFGGRHHFWLVVACALPAYLTRRPVRMVFSRREVFEATQKGHPFRLTYRMGARQDGQLIALKAQGCGDAGPYGGAPGIAPFVALCGSGPYIWSAIDYEVRVAHTNGPNAGPFRGYGMPHGVLGLECCLDELASKLQVDPWSLRMANAADQSTGACTGQPFDEPFGFKQVLLAIKPDWVLARRAVTLSRAHLQGGERRGAGLAAAWYQFGRSGELRTAAQAELRLDGAVVLYYSAMTSGQGLDTVMSQLAADELGVSREIIRLVNSDTDLTLNSHIYGACRSTYWVGGAVVQACRTLKDAVINVAGEMLGYPADYLRLADGGVRVAGEARQSVGLAEVAAEFSRRGLPLKYTGIFDLEARYPEAARPPHLGHFTVGAAVAEVSVNLRTGRVKALRLVVAQDAGRVINPIDVRGQIEGAAVMDLGAVLTEEYVLGQTLDFKSYRLPRMRDVPELKVIVVEVPGHAGPHGVKGIGEAALGHVRAAVLNAIADATGVRIRRLPATPQRVLEALQAEGHDWR